MTSTARTASSILVASDNSTDAELVKTILAGQFDAVFTSTDPGKAVEDFERRLPEVLVLAFNTLEKSERYCLGLYRLSGKIHLQPHRTVILCDKEEVRRAGELCMNQYFDDYVLFWPMNYDAPRLPVSVSHALRELAALKDGGPSAAEFAAQARRLSELETFLDQKMALGGRRIEVASLTMEQAEQKIGAALDGFSRRLGQGALQDVVEIKDTVGLEREMARFKREDVQPPLRAVADSVLPLKQWGNDFRKEYAPYLESARALSAMADRVRPTILMVDDDDFQRKMVARILEAENYRLVFAASGAEALNVLRKLRPELILMDVLMPDIDGIEATRRLKAAPHLANVPVIMVTGKSEGNVVVDSLKAGAVDFVVKPFDRDTLLAKVARWSRQKASPSDRNYPG